MKVGLSLLWLLLFSPVSAEEPVAVSLKAEDGFYTKICTDAVWEKLPVFWKGVIDRRPSREIGVQTKKRKPPMPVSAEPPLEVVFEEAIKKVLTRCGMEFRPAPSPETLNLSVQITEFHADVEKKFVRGLGEAKSQLLLIVEKIDSTNLSVRELTVQVGYEMESKELRKRKLRQLEAALQELFAKTLEQIPTSKELRQLPRL